MIINSTVTECNRIVDDESCKIRSVTVRSDGVGVGEETSQVIIRSEEPYEMNRALKFVNNCVRGIIIPNL